ARFQAFTDQHLLKLDPDRSMSVGFNGSVAWTFSELLQEVMESSGFRNIVILRDPLPALSLFHQKGTGI
ncbi:MAG TPA: hypothetical protein P5248_05035, partial [Bacteroidales bacterium]|nr:hypothetical protein [Bacteroidales bacterium]